MQRRTLLSGATAALATVPLARPHAQKTVTVRWWYHLDDPKATPDEFIAAFEKANPGIHIEAENIPWGGGGDYDNRIYTSIIAGNGPDTAMVKFNNLARLMEMEALTPLDKWIDAWPGKSDISDDLWRLAVGTFEKKSMSLGSLMAHADVLSAGEGAITLAFGQKLDVARAEKARAEMEAIVSATFGQPMRLTVQVGGSGKNGLAMRSEVGKENDAAAADRKSREQEARQHPLIRSAQDVFGASLKEIKT